MIKGVVVQGRRRQVSLVLDEASVNQKERKEERNKVSMWLHNLLLVTVVSLFCYA